MARGVNSCLYCRSRLVWRDGAWRKLQDGEATCAYPEDHRHRLAPA